MRTRLSAMRLSKTSLATRGMPRSLVLRIVAPTVLAGLTRSGDRVGFSDVLRRANLAAPRERQTHGSQHDVAPSANPQTYVDREGDAGENGNARRKHASGPVHRPEPGRWTWVDCVHYPHSGREPKPHRNTGRYDRDKRDCDPWQEAFTFEGRHQ